MNSATNTFVSSKAPFTLPLDFTSHKVRCYRAYAAHVSLRRDSLAGVTMDQLEELTMLTGTATDARRARSSDLRVAKGVVARVRGYRLVRITLATAALVTLSASLLSAHDFWLVPDAFAVTPGGRIAVRGQTSSLFPTSLSAVTADRLMEARVLTADGDVQIRDATVSGSSLVLGHRPARTGQHVIGVRLAPRSVRESPASFRRYLDLEGAPEARQRYEREGLLDTIGGDSITRRYAKYAKSFVEVGKGGGARAYHRSFGHPLELVPLSDPSLLKAADTLRLRLMLLGKPAPFARVHAGSAPRRATSLADTTEARRAAVADASIQADSAGVVRVLVNRAGLWNVRTIQIVPAAKGSGADWDVHWATIVFPVARR